MKLFDLKRLFVMPYARKSALLLSAALSIFAAGSVVAQNDAQQDTHVVNVYGHNFTIDTDKIDDWNQTAYLVPDLIQGALNKGELLSVSDALQRLSEFSAHSRYEIYECSIYEVAQRMERDGQLDAAFLSPDEQGRYTAQPIPERLVNGTPQERIDWIYAEIGDWIINDTWLEHVKAYNSYRGSEALSPYAFEKPKRFYDAAQALRNLEIAVRRSPEVSAAKLSEAQRVKPFTPSCMRDIGPDDYSEETLKGRPRIDSDFPFVNGEDPSP